MALTKNFRETVQARAQREPAFRRGLLCEGLELINTGDFATGRAVLRSYINATIGFPALSNLTGISSPSLQRMFGPNGNPRAENLFTILAELQRNEGIEVHLLLKAS